MSKIIAIDAGTTESGYVVFNKKPLGIIDKGKISNEELLQKLIEKKYEYTILEMVQSYGMAVGNTVFETCVWIGRFIQANAKTYCKRYYRKEPKVYFASSTKVNDKILRSIMIDIWGNKGTKKKPGGTYGFTKDAWQALVIGTLFIAKSKKLEYVGGGIFYNTNKKRKENIKGEVKND